MTTQITLTLPEEVYRRASHLAQLLNRDLADVLTEAITLSLSPVAIPPHQPSNTSFQPIATLSDTEIIALTELEMEPDQDQRLSELLDQQQAGVLTDAERPELSTLMQIYQEKLLQKAQALREAVQRGLREPLTP